MGGGGGPVTKTKNLDSEREKFAQKIVYIIISFAGPNQSYFSIVRKRKYCGFENYKQQFKGIFSYFLYKYLFCFGRIRRVSRSELAKFSVSITNLSNSDP